MARVVKVAIAIDAIDNASDTLTSLADKIKKSWANVGLAIAGAGAAAGTALFALAKSAADAGSAAFVAADRVGVSVEKFTQLGFAAKQVGAEADTMQDALGELAQRAVNNAKDFERWGIATREATGELKSSDRLLESVANRIQAASTETERLALADELLSDAGRQLLPLLREGSEGIQKFADEADRLGVTLSSKTAKAANDFQKQLGKLESQFGGLRNVAAAELLPVFTDLFTKAQDFVADLTRRVKNNDAAFRTLAVGGIKALAFGISLLVKGAAGLVFVVDGVRLAFRHMVSANLTALQEFSEGLASIGVPGAEELRDKLREMAREANAETVAAARAAEERQTALSGLISSVDTFVQKIGEVNEAEETLSKNRRRRRREDILAEEQRKAKIAEAAKVDADAHVQAFRHEQELQARREEVRQQERTAQEAEAKRRREAEQAALDFRLERERAFLAKQEELNKKRTDAIVDGVAQFEGAFTDAFAQVIMGTEEAGKAFARLGEIVLNTIIKTVLSIPFKLFLRALGTLAGGPAGGIAAGGLGSILGFQRGGVVGMATGGLVVGGFRGRDSVPALLEPGELVVPAPAVRRIANRQPLTDGDLSHRGGTKIELNMGFLAPPDRGQLDRVLRDTVVPALKRLEGEGAF